MATDAQSFSSPPSFRLQPPSAWGQLSRHELWRYRELLFTFVWRDLKVRYKQTLLGVMWAVLQPAMSTLVFWFIFRRLAKVPTQDLSYPVSATLGILPWAYIAHSVNTSSLSLLNYSHLIEKVYFPRIFIPATVVLSSLVDYLCGFAVVAGLALWYRSGIPLTFFLMFPVVVATLVLLALGLALWSSALTARFRDLKYIIPFGLQLWMFLSPVAYRLDFVPDEYRWLLQLNPVVGPIETLRHTFAGTDGYWPLLGLSAGTALFLVVTGTLFFARIEREITDML